MDEQVTNDSIIDDMHEALAATLLKHERSMLGQWVILAASTEEDGSRGVWALASRENLPFETLGLLHDGLRRCGDSSFDEFMDEDEA